MVGPSRSCDNTDVDVMGQGERDSLFLSQEDFREMMPFSALNLYIINNNKCSTQIRMFPRSF